MIQVAFTVFCLLQFQDAYSKPKCQEDLSDYLPSYGPGSFDNTLLPEDHFCKEKPLTIYHQKPIPEFLPFEGKQPNVSTAFISEYSPTDAPPISLAFDESSVSSQIHTNEPNSFSFGDSEENNSPLKSHACEFPMNSEQIELDTSPFNQIQRVPRSTEAQLVVPGCYMTSPVTSTIDGASSLSIYSNDLGKNPSFLDLVHTSPPKLTKISYGDHVNSGDGSSLFPDDEPSINPEELDKSFRDSSMIPIISSHKSADIGPNFIHSDQTASECETSVVTVPKFSDIFGVPPEPNAIALSSRPYATSPAIGNIETIPFTFPPINPALLQYPIYSSFGQFLPSLRPLSQEIKPVYEEVVCNIPAVRNTLKNRVVETTRHVPIVEKTVVHEQHKVIKHVPVVQKVRRNVVEYRTKHVPVVRHRTRVLEEPYTVHVQHTERISRPVIETVVNKVPVVFTHTKPVVHHRVRHIPIVETRCHPVVEETVTTVPIRKKVLKNVIEDKFQSLIFPPPTFFPL